MATWYLGPLRIGQGIARQAGLAGGVAAVAGGLAIGVATAADPGALQAAPATLGTPGAPAGQTTLATPLNPKPAPAPRLPLHQLLAAKIGGRAPAAQPVKPAQRMIIGRLTSFAGGTATVQTARGQVVTVHANAQTSLPKRQTRVGDQVLIIGRPEPGGAFLARAVLSRPPPARPKSQSVARSLR